MSEEVSTDSTAAPVEQAAPVATGPTVAELQAQLDEAKRQSEGRLRDLQQERQKRQEYEARMQQPQVVAPQPVVQEADDEVAKLINPYVERAVTQKVERALTQRMEQTYHQDKAWAFMESKLGKTKDQIMADPEIVSRFTKVIDKYGINKGNIYEQTVAAYELMELEGLKAKVSEKARNTNIAAAQPLAGGNPPAPVSSKTFSANAFNSLSTAEFDKLSQAGSFRKVDGEFVYTPR